MDKDFGDGYGLAYDRSGYAPASGDIGFLSNAAYQSALNAVRLAIREDDQKAFADRSGQ